MLERIEVQNIALIEKLGFEPGAGMTVLTGETGAGKSIILDAVGLVLGNRANKGLVRYGCEKAFVQAVFSVSEEISAQLESAGIPDEDGMLIISRELSADGKSICRMNGVICVQNTVREICEGLLNLHGQQDSQGLLNPKKHLAFLDSYADDGAEIEAYSEIYREKLLLSRQLKSLEMDESDRLARIDLLTYQTKEIEAAHLRAGEMEELHEQRFLMQNAEKIVTKLEEAHALLYGNSECPVYDQLSRAVEALSVISGFDADFDRWYQRLEESKYLIQEIAEEISDRSQGMDYDERELNAIEERLDVISRMMAKYGGSEEAVLAFYQRSQAELLQISDCDEAKGKLEKALEECETRLQQAANVLHQKRMKAAERLSGAICSELKELDMSKAEFRVAVLPTDCSALGADEVIFFIRPNPGEAEQPLEKIASGGELSRIMLAIKMILSDADSVDTLIFDEIDTGVSGSAAKKIAQKLRTLGQKKQVICVSHQPQLAAAANRHFLIEKMTKAERTTTKLTELLGEERIRELARIIDGDSITDTSLNHAKEMMEAYEQS
ncbi:MAG: DNA repair protein RecN [Ruminococcaceae bacterium]|nr:DNA repair protein RecN [Oscillospiraceae bacterium]